MLFFFYFLNITKIIKKWTYLRIFLGLKTVKNKFSCNVKGGAENLRRKKVAASSSLLASSASAARETARAPAKAYL